MPTQSLELTQQEVLTAIQALLAASGGGSAVNRNAVASATEVGTAALVMHRVAETTDTADGDWDTLTVDNLGHLKVTSTVASLADVIGDVNAVNGQLAIDTSQTANICFFVKNTGSVTLAAGTFVWEASLDSTDGANGTWFAIQAVRVGANTIENTIALSGMAAGAGFTTAWEASVNAYNWVRIRCTVAVTASAIAHWMVARGTYSTEPIPAIQAHAVTVTSGAITATGTGTYAVTQSGNWNVFPGNGTAYTATTTASTNGANVKATGASLGEISVSNPTATACFVKLYNKATAPTVGTDVPILTIRVAATGSAGDTVSLNFGPMGKRFASGLGIAVTAGVAATDVANAVAGVVVSLTYS
jgi:hypothetical protein